MNNKELTNNPINTCLIQIEFSSILVIEKSIDKLQDVYRKNGFPNFKEVEVSTYNITDETQLPKVTITKKWLFYTADKKDLIILDSTQISYQVSTYTNFSKFLESFKKILKNFSVIVEFSNNTLIKRIGLRYVNCFEGIENFKKYLKKEYQGINLSKSIKTKNDPLINTTIRCPLLINDEDLSNLLLRVYQNRIGRKVPLNIFSLQEITQKQDKLITFLDIDHSLNFESYSLNNLEDIYIFAKDLNNISTELFLDAITDKAKEDWKWL
jgi:uncharacterized protein (TIGR04255 family)